MILSSYFILMLLTVAQNTTAGVPEWVHFPGEEWETITPQEAGLDAEKFNTWIKEQKPQFGKAYGGQKPEKGGVVIVRGGYLLHSWGDSDFRYQSGKNVV